MKAGKYILAIALTAQVFCAQGQRSWTTSGGKVSYSVLETDPDKYKRTALCIELAGVDTYNDVSAGTNIKLETLIGDRIMPFFQIRHSWMDFATMHHAGSYPKSIGGLQKQSIMDVGGVYFFHSKKKSVSVKVVLRTWTSGRYTTIRSVVVAGEVRRQAGIRGGLFAFRKALPFEEGSHDRFHYQSADGLTILPISNVGVSAYPQPAGDAYMPIAMSHVACTYGGFHVRNIKNTSIRADGYGKRSNAKVTDFYIDVMYAPTIKIDNVRDAEGKEWAIVPQDGALRHLGWRVGYSLHSAKNFGIVWSTEFGKRPGAILEKSFLSNGTYITFNFGVSIGSGKYLKLNGKEDKKDS